MADAIPEVLKKPEISRFINRANQVRTFKPAIAYWCEYHAVNQIVSKGLHNADDAAFDFTRALIERLETTKAEHATDDAVVDNAAGQAYVEQFAQDTFARAERALRADKVTRQTADTFDAAATFFDLLNAWGPLDAETAQKIKFAKWNAARIIRAIREGKDPNESNPKLPEPEPELPTDADLESELAGSSAARPVQVEDVSDAGEPLPPVISSSAAQPPSVSASTSAEPPLPSPSHDGYFPSPTDGQHPEPFVPSPLSHSPVPGPGMPPPPLSMSPEPGPQKPPPVFSSQQQPIAPGSAFQSPDPSAPPSWTTTPSASHPASSNPPPVMPGPSAPQVYTPPAPVPVRAPAPAPAPAAAPAFTPSNQGAGASMRDMAEAQKHAKWAISALNFEDVPTAIKELRSALASLGAQ
jgi:vacuolar protein sorting-associated protein VTA1